MHVPVPKIHFWTCFLCVWSVCVCALIMTVRLQKLLKQIHMIPTNHVLHGGAMGVVWQIQLNGQKHYDVCCCYHYCRTCLTRKCSCMQYYNRAYFQLVCVKCAIAVRKYSLDRTVLGFSSVRIHRGTASFQTALAAGEGIPLPSLNPSQRLWCLDSCTFGNWHSRPFSFTT